MIYLNIKSGTSLNISASFFCWAGRPCASEPPGPPPPWYNIHNMLSELNYAYNPNRTGGTCIYSTSMHLLAPCQVTYKVRITFLSWRSACWTYQWYHYSKILGAPNKYASILQPPHDPCCCLLLHCLVHFLKYHQTQWPHCLQKHPWSCFTRHSASLIRVF